MLRWYNDINSFILDYISVSIKDSDVSDFYRYVIGFKNLLRSVEFGGKSRDIFTLRQETKIFCNINVSYFYFNRGFAYKFFATKIIQYFMFYRLVNREIFIFKNIWTKKLLQFEISYRGPFLSRQYVSSVSRHRGDNC